MARYHTDNRMGGTQQNITTTYKTITSVMASSVITRRGRAVGLSVGADTNAYNTTDCQISYSVQRQTVSGTATAVTPAPLLLGDTASFSNSNVNATIEGTITAGTNIWGRVLNQRASMQWVAQDTDAMLLWPATSSSGLVGLALSPTLAAPVFFGIDYEDL